jgi:hypothetical protein
MRWRAVNVTIAACRFGPNAEQPMRAVLKHEHADRRQLGELMAAEPARRPALVDRKLATASAASIGIVIDDLVDLVLRREFPTRAAMSRLTARRARRALPAQHLLRSRTRLRTTLLARLGRVRRRRL